MLAMFSLSAVVPCRNPPGEVRRFGKKSDLRFHDGFLFEAGIAYRQCESRVSSLAIPTKTK